MTSILPRWEWRTFGPAFGDAEQQLATVLSPPARSEETYIVGAGADLNVKVRHGQLEIKACQQVSAEGLEQWLPVMKAAFPLNRDAIAALYAAWPAAPPLAGLPANDAETFVRELVDRDPGLSRVGVVKTRRSGSYDGCLVEIAALAFDGEPARTLAVEHEDPTRVLAVLRALRLSPHDNVNYVRALERFVTLRAARLARGAKEAPCHDETVSA